MSTQLGRNLFSGFASSAWTAVIGLLVVPFYLRYLGLEAYGLIGLFTAMQALFQLLDLGVAPAINREVARSSVSGEISHARDLLHTLAVVYWSTALLIAALAVAAGPVLSLHWLNANHLSQLTIQRAVVLMGLVIAIRWPLGLYLGVLIGAQRLTVSSAINIIMITVSNVGALLILKLVSNTIEAFFLWQALSGLLNVLVLRAAAWRVLKGEKRSRFDLAKVKQIWRFSAGMGLVAVLGLLLTHLDKFVLSKFVTLQDLGLYNLAGFAARSLYLVLSPVFSAMFPRFSAMVAVDETGKIEELYKIGTRVLLAVVFPVAAYVILFSKEIFLVWTHDPAIAGSVQVVVAFLVFGTAMNGVMHFPYAIQLAYGNSRLPVSINLLLIVIFIPMLILLSQRAGIAGAAASWAILNTMYVGLGTWLTHREILKGIATGWLVRDVGIPFGLTLLIVGVGSAMVFRAVENMYLHLGLGALLSACACLAILSTSSRAISGVRQIFLRPSSRVPVA
jgi:O-antigen/teichoic acid export membrane protein